MITAVVVVQGITNHIVTSIALNIVAHHIWFRLDTELFRGLDRVTVTIFREPGHRIILCEAEAFPDLSLLIELRHIARYISTSLIIVVVYVQFIFNVKNLLRQFVVYWAVHQIEFSSLQMTDVLLLIAVAIVMVLMVLIIFNRSTVFVVFVKFVVILSVCLHLINVDVDLIICLIGIHGY